VGDLTALRGWAIRLWESGVSGWRWLRDGIEHWYRCRPRANTPGSAPLGEGRFSGAAPVSIADIPPALRRRLQADAIEAVFCRLEEPLRFLLHATEPGQPVGSPEEYRHILNLWRHGLAQELQLVPETFAGSVRSYEPGMERDYTLRGRCRSGDRVRILVPCWRLHGQTVVRGEAEPLT
jgi:hypothetical protein